MDEAYIDKEDQGDLVAMTPTIVDMLGVFFLKVQFLHHCSASMLKASSPQASSYEFMAESSRQGSTAYWYLVDCPTR